MRPPSSLQGEILRLLNLCGRMCLDDLERSLAKATREQITRSADRLRSSNKLHIEPEGKFSRNPTYVLGPDPDEEERERRAISQEMAYRRKRNPHLRRDWKPHRDAAAAWI